MEKHHVSFQVAQGAFMDSQRVIARDMGNSEIEERFYCFGKVEGGVLTVRFTYRGKQIRIFGAGFWRKGKQIYDKENNLFYFVFNNAIIKESKPPGFHHGSNCARRKIH